MDDQPKKMEIIWAPWRMAYIKPNDSETNETDKITEKDSLNQKELSILPGGEKDCFLCQAAADCSEHDGERFVIGRTERTISVLNRYPYNNGHLLVAPKRHIARLDLLTPEEWLELSEELTFWTTRIERIMNSDGFNVGLNLGRVAGAGLPGHLHWHIVPRWNGDTNFFTTIGSTKAIPQSLEALWSVLKR
ncbi:MAG: HIT domain-containing protein [Planctomycetia bacterium]|nr:HIT domain-containing protein [Planctomycetia bacterium]